MSGWCRWRIPLRLRTLLVGQFLAAMLVAVVVLTLMMVFWRLPLVQEQTRQEQARVADLALANMDTRVKPGDGRR